MLLVGGFKLPPGIVCVGVSVVVRGNSMDIVASILGQPVPLVNGLHRGCHDGVSVDMGSIMLILWLAMISKFNVAVLGTHREAGRVEDHFELFFFDKQQKIVLIKRMDLWMVVEIQSGIFS